MQKGYGMNGLGAVMAGLGLMVALLGCGDDGGSGSGGGDSSQRQVSEVAFDGEIKAFPDVVFDSGFQPEGSPVQAQVKFNLEAALKARAEALVGGNGQNPIMSGKEGTGLYELALVMRFEVLAKIDLPGVGFEGPVGEDLNLVFEVTESVPFDPFVVGEAVDLSAEVPLTQVATIPLAGSVPGVDGNVLLNIQGTINSAFEGKCAAVNASAASYQALTTTGADLEVLPSIEVNIPFVFDEVVELGAFPVSVPAVPVAMDLGTLEVSPGGGAVDGGGSLASVGTCDDVGNNAPNNDPSNNDPNNNDPNNDNNGPNNDPNNSPNNAPNNNPGECAPDCRGCCQDGLCLRGVFENACGGRGEVCSVCESGEVCEDQECVPAAPPCGPDNCGGCCDGGVCQTGESDFACGSFGDVCQECAADEVCGNGFCVLAGECFSDQDCGFEEVCEDQVCVSVQPQCDANNCDGCCDGDVCRTGTSDFACGAFGNLCLECADDEACGGGLCVVPGGCFSDEDCGQGEVCVNGQCEAEGIAPDSLWDVLVLDAVVLRDPPRGGWDVFDEADPYVEVTVNSTQETGRTSTIEDTLTPDWGEVVLEFVRADNLQAGGLTMTMLDEDSISRDEVMGNCGVSVNNADVFGGQVQTACSRDVMIMFRLLEAR